mgnify:CR=1 FL=1
MNFLRFALFVGILGIATSFDLKELESLVFKLATDELYIKDFENHIKFVESIEPNYFNYTPFSLPEYTFNCDTSFMKSKETPSSVHALRPGDIQVVGALGDSLTAALGAGAKTVLGLLLEYRGRSWSAGGESNLEKIVTMPNILRKFNPNLKGFTVAKDISLLHKNGVGLNVAVSGQEANHIPEQARNLVKRMKEAKDFDYKNDWKLVNLFIGGNDLCDFCRTPDIHNPKAYVDYIRQGLDIIKAELPRTFVNLVLVLKVSDVKLLNRGLVCNVLHHFECPCGAFPTPQQEKELEEYINEYHELTQELVDSGRYDTSDDFTVVIQPFFRDFKAPRLPNNKIDYSFFAPDCFHFAPKGHGIK